MGGTTNGGEGGGENQIFKVQWGEAKGEGVGDTIFDLNLVGVKTLEETMVSNTHPLSKEELLSVMLWCSFVSSTQFYLMNPELTHCTWVQFFDKDLNRLIYLGYWSTEHWKYLVSEKDAKANINLLELKFVKLR